VKLTANSSPWRAVPRAMPCILTSSHLRVLLNSKRKLGWPPGGCGSTLS